MRVPDRRNKTVIYRSYKHFDESRYLNDLSQAPFHVAETFDDSYWFYSKMLSDVINEHAPIKTSKVEKLGTSNYPI